MEASNSPILQKLTEKTSFSDSSVTVHAVAVTISAVPMSGFEKSIGTEYHVCRTLSPPAPECWEMAQDISFLRTTPPPVSPRESRL